MNHMESSLKVEHLLFEFKQETENLDFTGKKFLFWFLRMYYIYVLLRGY